MQITLSAGLTTHHQEQKNLSKKNPGEEWNKSEEKEENKMPSRKGRRGERE